jgi:hypothetical protein
MSSLDERVQAALARVHERISAAALAAGRDPASVALLAVSKAFGPDAVLAAARAGQASFGENYVQEGIDKIAAVRRLDPTLGGRLQWHFIGPVQSNKTRAIAEHFDWVHSIERAKVAQRLAVQRPALRAPLAVLIQVNVSGEATKSGVDAGDVFALADEIAALPRLALRGLMAIPEPAADPTRQRAPFARIRALFDELRRRGHGVDTMSMGMSADLEAAIAEGATLVRVGTAIFGSRERAARDEPAVPPVFVENRSRT